jgi:hypothetical protein
LDTRLSGEPARHGLGRSRISDEAGRVRAASMRTNPNPDQGIVVPCRTVSGREGATGKMATVGDFDARLLCSPSPVAMPEAG